MKLHTNPIKLALSSFIKEALSQLDVEQTENEIYAQLGSAPNLAMGHFAFPCFPFAKVMKKSPALIAVEIGKHIPENSITASWKPTGPYLNFFINPEAIGQAILNDILSGNFFQKALTRDTPKAMVEYSQPNTHKELHVGHMRNVCLGDSLIRLHRYCGYDIISSTFPGDMGTHVAKCLWYLKYRNQEAVPESNKGAWLGSMYSKAYLALEEAVGSPEEAINKTQISEILKQLEARTGEFYDLWKETRQWSIELMESVYEWADIHFEEWYWESEVDSASLELVRKYKAEGVFVESKGATGMDLSEDGLGFALLLKSDGNGLYMTKDIELARRKFEDYKIEKDIYIVDKRQAHHFAQLFKVLEKMGFEQAKNCHHLQYNYVELPDGPMASRKGNIIPIMDLIRNMETTVTQTHLEKYRGEWTDEEIEKTASDVSKGAIRYGMLRMDPSKKIVFEMQEWLRTDGESGPYIQYVCARINSICEKLAYNPKDAIDWALLTEPSEMALLVKMIGFNDIVLNACQGYKPNVLCGYLYEMAKLFNNFYAHVSIKNTEDQKLKNTRLALCKAVANTISNGFSLLGIPVPNRM